MELDENKVSELIIGSIPLAKFVEADILELDKGYVKMRIPFEPNVNHIGIMYAGSLFTLGELPGGCLFFSAFDASKCYPIVTEMTIKFLKPATTAMTVESRISEEEIQRITREVEEKGKSVYILEQEIKDEKGEVCAITTGRYQARAHGR
ncbi:MAG: PaaI family thioesterase [Pseudomonadota bacterium]|nr:thioesterase [Pseudomonadales bacterium]MDY6919632.1 PaaI family thioesterase [Pseudomonadota bacterium]